MVGGWYFAEKRELKYKFSLSFSSWNDFAEKSYAVEMVIFDIHKCIFISLSSFHVIGELFLITLHIKDIELDELAISNSYDIRHFLGRGRRLMDCSFNGAFLKLNIFIIYEFSQKISKKLWIFGHG